MRKPNLALNAEIESSGRAASPQEHSNDTNTGQTSSNDCFSNNAPEPAMTVTSRNLQVITGRVAREGARERVCFAQKPATKMAMWATQQPQRGALHLVPRGRPQASIVLSA
jgi:hypothetical protein